MPICWALGEMLDWAEGTFWFLALALLLLLPLPDLHSFLLLLFFLILFLILFFFLFFFFVLHPLLSSSYSSFSSSSSFFLMFKPLTIFRSHLDLSSCGIQCVWNFNFEFQSWKVHQVTSFKIVINFYIATTCFSMRTEKKTTKMLVNNGLDTSLPLNVTLTEIDVISILSGGGNVADRIAISALQ